MLARVRAGCAISRGCIRSIRCAPHVIGPLRDVLDWVMQWITVEINSSDDNPLFNVAGGRVESGGNFYGGHVGQAMDSLKVALANLCDLMDRQLELVEHRREELDRLRRELTATRRRGERRLEELG